MPEHGEGRPSDKAANPQEHQPGLKSTQTAARHADLAMRVAWLRVQGDLLFDADESGLLTAQLWDLADLLEVLDAEGRWDQ